MIGLDIAASPISLLLDSLPLPCSPPDSPSPPPTSACAIHPVNAAGVAGRLIGAASPGAMSIGVVGPSSVPFERCTSIQGAVGRVLHSALEGVAYSVVAQDQSCAASNCVEGLIRRQYVGAALFVAAYGRFTAAFTTRAVFTAALTTFSAGFVAFASTAVLATGLAAFSL